MSESPNTPIQRAQQWLDGLNETLKFSLTGVVRAEGTVWGQACQQYSQRAISLK